MPLAPKIPNLSVPDAVGSPGTAGPCPVSKRIKKPAGFQATSGNKCGLSKSMLNVSPGAITDAKGRVARAVSPPNAQDTPHAAGSKLELVSAKARDPRLLNVVVGK